MTVNIGAYHPSAWLQRWLNVFNRSGNYPDIHVDGNIGRGLAALEHYLARRGREGSRFGESPQLQSGRITT